MKTDKSLEFLLTCSEKYLQFDHDSLDYQMFADDMRELSGASLVCMNLFDESGKKAKTVAVSGSSSTLQKLQDLLQVRLVGQEWDVLPGKVNKLHQKGLIAYHNLHELGYGHLSLQTARLIEKHGQVGAVYALAIGDKDRVLGEFNLAMPGAKTISDGAPMEILAHQVRLLLLRLQAEKKICDKDKILMSITENMLDMVSIVDDKGIIEYVTPSHKKILGYESEEMVGKLIFEFLHPLEIERIEQIFYQAIKNQDSAKTEGRILGKDGKYRWVEVVGNVIVEEEIVTGGVIRSRDITERKENEKLLREREQKYRQLFEATPVSLWENDYSLVKQRVYEIKSNYTGDLRTCFEDNLELVKELANLVRVIDFNEATVRLYQAKTEEDLFRGITSVFHEESYHDFIETLLAIAENRTEHYTEKTHQTFEGEILQLQTYFSVVSGCEETYSRVLFSSVDITARKQAEDLLQSQLQFEKMVSQISSYFVSLPPGKMERGINYALKLIGEYFQVDRSYVYHIYPEEGRLKNTYMWCDEEIAPHLQTIYELPLSSVSWLLDELKKNGYVYVYDVTSIPEHLVKERKLYQQVGIQTFAGLPLLKEGSIFGFLGFDVVKEKKAWAEEQMTLLRIVAELISNALARKETEDEIRYLSFHDSLTGIYNRTYFLEEMRRLSGGRDYPVTIIAADVNGLKMVNDTMGHAKGDELLIACAEILRSSLRSSDILARVGGDEFIILLPGTDEAEGNEIIKRIRHNVAARNQKQPDLPLSIALGMVTVNNQETSLEEAYNLADDLMYQDKQITRNYPI